MSSPHRSSYFVTWRKAQAPQHICPQMDRTEMATLFSALPFMQCAKGTPPVSLNIFVSRITHYHTPDSLYKNSISLLFSTAIKERNEKSGGEKKRGKEEIKREEENTSSNIFLQIIIPFFLFFSGNALRKQSVLVH